MKIIGLWHKRMSTIDRLTRENKHMSWRLQENEDTIKDLRAAITLDRQTRRDSRVANGTRIHAYVLNYLLRHGVMEQQLDELEALLQSGEAWNYIGGVAYDGMTWIKIHRASVQDWMYDFLTFEVVSNWRSL